jgi:hypothetical protein
MQTLSQLFTAFKEPDQIQAICAVLGLIVATAGTFYVVRSFNIQKDINKLQEKINLQQAELNVLAWEADRRSIRPIFELKTIKEPLAFGPKFQISLSNANAIDVAIFKCEKFGQNVGEPDLYQIWKLNTAPLNLDLAEETFSENYEFYKYNICFKDEVGRQYCQSVKIDYQDVFITFPEPTKPNNITSI